MDDSNIYQYKDLESTKNPELIEDYPKIKVILTYVLFQGALTGLISALFVAFSSFVSDPMGTILLSVTLGGIAGFIPSLLLAICLTYFKVKVLNPKDYGAVFLISASIMMVFIAFAGGSEIIGVVLISGFVSVLLAKLVLPKK